MERIAPLYLDVSHSVCPSAKQWLQVTQSKIAAQPTLACLVVPGRNKLFAINFGVTGKT